MHNNILHYYDIYNWATYSMPNTHEPTIEEINAELARAKVEMEERMKELAERFPVAQEGKEAEEEAMREAKEAWLKAEAECKAKEERLKAEAKKKAKWEAQDAREAAEAQKAEYEKRAEDMRKIAELRKDEEAQKAAATRERVEKLPRPSIYTRLMKRGKNSTGRFWNRGIGWRLKRGGKPMKKRS
jgi:membrane protein involved in colicin uptake